MDILELIKGRKTIRKYQGKPIPREIIDKIIEAGIWGPSVPSFLMIQPWRFVVIEDKKIKKEITEIILKKSKEIGAGANILLSSSGRIIDSAPIVIMIYNSGDLKKLESKYKVVYDKFGEIIPRAELSAISATIQNMILVAEGLGVSSCWLDTPLFCKDEINQLLKAEDELIAVLTLGYRAEEGKRCQRKPFSEMVSFVK